MPDQPPPTGASEATFALSGEDHTLGNVLCTSLHRTPDVSFAGYTVPHPADDVVHVRVQTTGRVTATQALKDAAMGAHPPWQPLASQRRCSFGWEWGEQ